jgi:hypothetical protein
MKIHFSFFQRLAAAISAAVFCLFPPRREVLYTEKGERKDAGSVGDPKELLKAVRNNDWNDYHVIVRSNLVVLRINDVVMSEVRDQPPKPSTS